MTGKLLFEALTISLAGAFLSLDRTAAVQAMISRPLVAAPVVGWFMGNAWAGLTAGIALELLFMGDLPVGSYVPAHETGIAVLTTALCATAIDAMGIRPFTPMGYAYTAMAVVPAALLVAVPAGKAYKLADYAARSLNSVVFHMAERALGREGGANLMKFNLAGLAVFFACLWAAFFITLAPLMLAAQAFFSGAKLTRFLHPAFAAVLVLGVASAISALGTGRKELAFFAAGIAATIIFMAV